MLHLYDGILPSNKKEQTSDTHDSTESQMHYANWLLIVVNGLHLHDSLEKSKTKTKTKNLWTENRLVLARGTDVEKDWLYQADDLFLANCKKLVKCQDSLSGLRSHRFSPLLPQRSLPANMASSCNATVVIYSPSSCDAIVVIYNPIISPSLAKPCPPKLYLPPCSTLYLLPLPPTKDIIFCSWDFWDQPSPL